MHYTRFERSFDEVAKWFRDRTVVVTGGYGYLGTGLTDRLRASGAMVRRSSRGRPEAAGNKEAWIGDLTDPEFCCRLINGADAIFHFSAQTSVPVAQADPFADLQANVHTTLTLLEACRTVSRPLPFVYAGTATETGFTEDSGARDHVVDQPATVYDANKLAAEQLIGVYTTQSVVHGVTLRIANVYGPGAAKSVGERGVTNKMIAHAMAGKDLTYYGDGFCLRDYVYIEDLLEAFLRSAAAANEAQRRSYAVSGGKGYSLREAFELIADVVATLGYPRATVRSAPWPEGTHLIDRRSYVADIAPIGEFCGWRPTVSLSEGIRLTAKAMTSPQSPCAPSPVSPYENAK